MPRFRFSVRVMMLAVAISAVSLALWLYLGMKTKPLARGYRALADDHAVRSSQLSTWPIASVPGEPAKTRARAAYHQALADKYGYLADHPWLPVSPDPPEPE